MYSKDVRTLVRLELEENPKVQAVVSAYEELTETEKALFRMGAGISLDTTVNIREHRHRTNDGMDSGNGDGEIQPLVKNLMKTLLEDQLTLLNDVDQRNLMDAGYCKSNLYLRIGNFALLRRRENGKFTARNLLNKSAAMWHSTAG